jgi:hypothetical protein
MRSRAAPSGILERNGNGVAACLKGESRHARARILGGVIAFNKRSSTMNCHVRNISPAGAKVALTNAAVIPDQFDLSIAQKARSYRARMVWRGVNEAGVAFLSEYTQDVPVPLEWVKRLRDSETEKAVLRQRIAQLTERDAV